MSLFDHATPHEEAMEEDASEYIELTHVTALSLAKLQQEKRQVIRQAQAMVAKGLAWGCGPHRAGPLAKSLDEILKANPFSPSSWPTEEMIEAMSQSNSCSKCSTDYPFNIQYRDGMRKEVQEMLEKAAARV